MWFSHRSGLVQDGEAEPYFHEGVLPNGCESMCFSCHFDQKDSISLESSFSVSDFSSKAAS